jgi:hypothetical protein
MFGAEAKRWFKVNVLSKSGELVVVPQLACTKYHAIELVFTRLREAQPDRSKYSTTKKGLS